MSNSLKLLRILEMFFIFAILAPLLGISGLLLDQVDPLLANKLSSVWTGLVVVGCSFIILTRLVLVDYIKSITTKRKYSRNGYNAL